MLNDSGSPQHYWSASVSTVIDLEQATANHVSIPLDTITQPHKDFGVLTVPARLRDDPGRQAGWWTHVGLSIICTFVAANLYYCQPLLIEIADSFHQSYAMAAWLPTMYQAGYCVGLLFISPLGDLVRRRQLILALISITICLSVGLALSRNFIISCLLMALIGVFNVTPQILLPLAVDYSAPQHRTSVVSILQSGIMLGILLARVLSGIIGYFTHWRTVFYMAIGVQAATLCVAYLLIPDHSPKNPHLTYSEILCSMAAYTVSEPRLVQAGLINLASVACWTNFWVTLTFLLDDEPYHFSTLWIGLFGLIGILGIFSAPLAARCIDGFGAWYSVLMATVCLLVLQCIETAAAGINIAVVGIVCFGIDVFRQTQTVSLQTIVFSISEEARSRLNAILTVSLFVGQVIGSSAGSHVFLRYGWRAAAALSVGFYGFQLVVLCVRGPNCGRHVWFGYGCQTDGVECGRGRGHPCGSERRCGPEVGDRDQGEGMLYKASVHASSRVTSVGDEETETGTEVGTGMGTEMMKQGTVTENTPCPGEHR